MCTCLFKSRVQSTHVKQEVTRIDTTHHLTNSMQMSLRKHLKTWLSRKSNSNLCNNLCYLDFWTYFCTIRSASYNSYFIHHSLYCECFETPLNGCYRCRSRCYSSWIAYVLWIQMANTNFGKSLAFKVDEVFKCGPK